MVLAVGSSWSSPPADRHQSRVVAQLLAERPAYARVLEAFGIARAGPGDAAGKTLAQACADRGVDVRTVVAILDLFDEHHAHAAAAHDDPDDVDWSKATLAELADHIEHTHHAFLKDELPRLEFLLNKIAGLYGDRDRRLIELRGAFASFKADMDLHMAKEERILFPACRQLTAAHTLPDFHCRRLDDPVAVLTAEHAEAAARLRRMRDLTDGFTAPPDACPTYRAALNGLAAVEADMYRHVRKEDAILYPAALDAEHRLRSLRRVHLSL